jgi:hypothetical protein
MVLNCRRFYNIPQEEEQIATFTSDTIIGAIRKYVSITDIVAFTGLQMLRGSRSVKFRYCNETGRERGPSSPKSSALSTVPQKHAETAESIQ